MPTAVWVALLIAVILMFHPSEPRYDAMEQSTVLVKFYVEDKPAGHGSGVITPYGILTAGHVAEAVPEKKGRRITVKFYDGTVIEATVEKSEFTPPTKERHVTKDIALLSAPIPPRFPRADVLCDKPEIGDNIYVSGHPIDMRWTITEGQVVTERPRQGYDPNAWTIVDNVVWSGNSGSPMFNKDGDVRGIITERNIKDFNATGHQMGVSPTAMCNFLGIGNG